MATGTNAETNLQKAEAKKSDLLVRQISLKKRGM
jgi:hypothetical protein